jgi:uncharacterized protein
MILSLKNIFISEGQSENFNANLEMSSVKTLLDEPVKNPVEVEGVLRNSAGVVTISYRVSTLLKADCARCFGEVEQTFEQTFEHTVVKTEADLDSEGDYLLALNDELDLCEVLASDLLLSLPSRFYCKEDCKGLCSVCGANLNEKVCNCKKDEYNPAKKLSMLSELLNK